MDNSVISCIQKVVLYETKAVFEMYCILLRAGATCQASNSQTRATVYKINLFEIRLAKTFSAL